MTESAGNSGRYLASSLETSPPSLPYLAVLLASGIDGGGEHAKAKDEDPRSVFYYNMLRRVGLPEVHARFAPWFLKSNQIQLSRWSAVLFTRLEQAFFAVPEQLSTLEMRMREHQSHYDSIMKAPSAASDGSTPLEPRQKNQLLLQRAFRDCSFHEDEAIARQRQQRGGMEKPAKKPKAGENQEEEDAVDKLELIPEVPVVNAPPGLAPQVRGQLESHGKHKFFTYNGRWRSGEMHGTLGVYAFADGGKYRGEFVDSRAAGSGTVVYPNGVKYTGGFANGKFHGFGVMEMERGYLYEGEFQRGQRCGAGKLLMLQSGAVYEGEFYDNMRHGQGTETSALGYSYTGTWQRNRISGKGRLCCPDKREVFRSDWPSMLLGEAIRLVKREQATASWSEELWYRRLLRVRDDLRALDLQYAFWDAGEARMEHEEEDRDQSPNHALPASLRLASSFDSKAIAPVGAGLDTGVGPLNGLGGSPDATAETNDGGTTLPTAEIGFGTWLNGELAMICPANGPASDVTAENMDCSPILAMPATSFS
ncbi:hypothetical protein BBJ28_00008585 [Nothophytophthora sp. Chile5]|nr:hypothetical protein BBJ28_00008585 [Nothophytophthora sp. Chile5]